MTTLTEQFESLWAKTGNMLKALEQMGYPPREWVNMPDELKQAIGMPTSLEPVVDDPKCPECFGHGTILVIQKRDGQVVGEQTTFCACPEGQAAQRDYYRRRFKLSGIPARFEQCTFATWDALKASDKRGKMLAYHCAKLLVEHRQDRYFFRLGEAYAQLKLHNPLTDDPARNSLVLYGDLGVGKTGLSASIANALASVQAVLYMRTQDLIKQVQDSYEQTYEGEGRSVIIQRVKTAPFLILDEMTLENSTNDRKEILEDIMRHRCGVELPFVVTTNHDQTSFRKFWGDRTIDPMLESAHWVPMGGENLRRKEQPAKAI